MSLSAVNLSQSAEDKMSPEDLSQVLVTAATALRLQLGRRVFSFLPGHLLSRAESISIQESLRWVFTPLGRQFFLHCDWSVKPEDGDDVFTSQRDATDPLAQLHRCFVRKLLEWAVLSLVTPQSPAHRQLKDSGEFSNALDFLQSLTSCTQDAPPPLPPFSSPFSQSSAPDSVNPDPVGRWWASVLKAAVHWLQGDDITVMSLLAEAERLPRALLVLDPPLSRAVLLLLRSLQVSLSQRSDVLPACLTLCDRVSSFLGPDPPLRSPQDLLHQGVEILLLDLQLTLRSSLWQHSGAGGGGAQLTGFHSDLNALRRRSLNYRPAQNKLFLHETTMRLMAGASPTRTHTLLERSLKRPPTECFLGERERANAILLACRHLPLTLFFAPNHRDRLLAEAHKTLDRTGTRILDRTGTRTQDRTGTRTRTGGRCCQQMLLRLAGQTTITAS